VGFELTTLVVIGTDCMGSCKSNYHENDSPNYKDLILEKFVCFQILRMSEKQGRGKKRPKSYYLKCAHKKVKHGNSLDIDMRGFLVTCNGNEKQAVREMYNLLNEYADKLYGPEEVGISFLKKQKKG
jgi:hypothetical protein